MGNKVKWIIRHLPQWQVTCLAYAEDWNSNLLMWSHHLLYKYLCPLTQMQLLSCLVFPAHTVLQSSWFCTNPGLIYEQTQQKINSACKKLNLPWIHSINQINKNSLYYMATTYLRIWALPLTSEVERVVKPTLLPFSLRYPLSFWQSPCSLTQTPCNNIFFQSKSLHSALIKSYSRQKLLQSSNSLSGSEWHLVLWVVKRLLMHQASYLKACFCNTKDL